MRWFLFLWKSRKLILIWIEIILKRTWWVLFLLEKNMLDKKFIRTWAPGFFLVYVPINNLFISGDGYVICDNKNVNLFILCVYILTTFEIILSWYSVDCNQNWLLFPIKVRICGTGKNLWVIVSKFKCWFRNVVAFIIY